MAQENARLALERKFEPARLNQAVLEGLQGFLGLVRLPRAIECFDISHGQGREVVASCVVFRDCLPDRQRYRRFKMTNQQNDDFANMAEVITRRYRRLRDEGQEFPDLVLIDGGLGQLHAAEAALSALGLDQLERASLAKKEELVFRPGSSEPLRIPKTSPVLQLLQRIRDEAHRFAITYHRQLRGKGMTKSALEGIPGLGPGRRTRLLKEYGTLKALRAAPLEDLRALGWLPEAVAAAVFDHLHAVARPPSSVRRPSAGDGDGELGPRAATVTAGPGPTPAGAADGPPEQSTDAADGEDQGGGGQDDQTDLEGGPETDRSVEEGGGQGQDPGRDDQDPGLHAAATEDDQPRQGEGKQGVVDHQAGD
jgi:hypothetical protein